MASKGDLAVVLGYLRSATVEGGFADADAAACARALGADGVAVSMAGEGGLWELVWSSPGVSAQLEDLQFTLGHGPGLEAAESCVAVLEPDLARVPGERWPALLPEVMALGVEAVFCFPLLLGGACLGTLTLQRSSPGPLEDARLMDAWIIADALTAVIAENAERWDASVDLEQDTGLYRARVHQAVGMISVQAGVSLAQALLRLRAYAFRHSRPVMEVAEDVVGRRVQFRNELDRPGTPTGEGTEGT
ncbi:hypothetical protein DI272_24130 [Streptomyces sp. Act143]|uniref:ANTAR domain-containing protein n=1 Tax=Streptomyces sp. Act143 TaxID=2200760 RepID=UPI000D67E123|nr:ANTAR domain-containing protein [Streptomyces sp. Act143]PWI16908.1 hypothetical protein DI272_24130 [Streptomyces sp. Act143]